MIPWLIFEMITYDLYIKININFQIESCMLYSMFFRINDLNSML